MRRARTRALPCTIRSGGRPSRSVCGTPALEGPTSGAAPTSLASAVAPHRRRTRCRKCDPGDRARTAPHPTVLRDYRSTQTRDPHPASSVIRSATLNPAGLHRPIIPRPAGQPSCPSPVAATVAAATPAAHQQESRSHRRTPKGTRQRSRWIPARDSGRLRLRAGTHDGRHLTQARSLADLRNAVCGPSSDGVKTRSIHAAIEVNFSGRRRTRPGPAPAEQVAKIGFSVLTDLKIVASPSCPARRRGDDAS